MRSRLTAAFPAVILALAVLLAASGLLLDLRFNFTASQPRGVYRLQPCPSPAERGQLLLLRLPDSIQALRARRGYSAWLGPVGKRLVAREGDLVEVGAEGLRVDGVLLEGTAPRAFDSRGRALLAASLHRPKRVAPGEIWVYSDHHPHSWDSRYWGPIPESAVLGCPEPLLVLP